MRELGYTEETYKEDLKIAKFVFYRHFKKWQTLKDDLIDIGIIRLCRVRERYDENISTYFNFACKVIERAMLRYVLAQFRQKRYINITSVSLDYEDENATLLDSIGIEDNTFEKLCNEQMVQAIKDIILKCSYKGNNKPKTRQKYLYDYFINGLNTCQIGAKYGVSRQAVDLVVKKYKKVIRDELVKQGFWG